MRGGDIFAVILKITGSEQNYTHIRIGIRACIALQQPEGSRKD